MEINARGKRKHLINIATTSNTYHEIGQNPVVEHGLFIPSPGVKTITLQLTHSPSYQELSGPSSQESIKYLYWPKLECQSPL